MAMSLRGGETQPKPSHGRKPLGAASVSLLWAMVGMIATYTSTLHEYILVPMPIIIQ